MQITATPTIRHNPRFIVAHVGGEGWDRDAPRSIFKPVPTDRLIASARVDLPCDKAARFEEWTSTTDGAVYCWGIPEGGHRFFDRMAPGDVVVFASHVSWSVGEGDVECVAEIDYVAPCPMPHTSMLVWDSNHYPLMYFFTQRTRLRMEWAQLLGDIGWKKNLNLMGNHRPVAAERLQAFGGVRGYFGHVSRSYRC